MDALGLMVALAAATIPVIGIEAVSYTPYLAMLSALRVPAPAWKWTVAFWVPAARWSHCSASRDSRPTSS